MSSDRQDGDIEYLIDAPLYFQLSPAYGGGPAPSPGYAESRSGWPGGPGGPQSSYGGPGSPSNSSSAPVSQPSPQPSQPPSHSPGPGPGMPPSPQHQAHQGFPGNRPPPATTPNAHAPDAAVSRNFLIYIKYCREYRISVSCFIFIILYSIDKHADVYLFLDIFFRCFSYGSHRE